MPRRELLMHRMVNGSTSNAGSTNAMLLGISVGTGFGVVVGWVYGNHALGMMLGLAGGMVLGAAIELLRGHRSAGPPSL